MNTEALQQQQLTLLARKALLQDELKQIEQAVAQIGAVLSFVQSQPAPAPEPTPTE